MNLVGCVVVSALDQCRVQICVGLICTHLVKNHEHCLPGRARLGQQPSWRKKLRKRTRGGSNRLEYTWPIIMIVRATAAEAVVMCTKLAIVFLCFFCTSSRFEQPHFELREAATTSATANPTSPCYPSNLPSTAVIVSRRVSVATFHSPSFKMCRRPLATSDTATLPYNRNPRNPIYQVLSCVFATKYTNK